MRRVALACLAAFVACAAPAFAAPAPWPPVQGPGHLFVHYGEEHWNDHDGLTLLPKVVAESIRYRPALVTMSGDKANDGVVDELTRWREIMGAYDRAKIPYFAGVGNHDGKAPGTPGGVSPILDHTNYRNVFAGRPYPFGDAAPYSDPNFSPRSRPASDPPGASQHYWVDYADVRWIFLDNSCYGLTNCDPMQNPRFPDAEGNGGQLEFLERAGGAAQRAGKRAFVVMHMPTRDPRDQSYTDTTAMNHVMGKGASPDNQLFEEAAERTGVDGVFVAHIKGQFLYRGRGNIPYYIDGGAGGELYTTGPVGADHGYWHGFRLVRVDGSRITTDTVPIFVAKGITINGPSTVGHGRTVRFEAFGRQPVFNDPAKVPGLELRDADPLPKGGSSGLLPAGTPWVAGPALLLVLVGWALGAIPLPRPRRRPLPAGVVAIALATLGVGSVALAESPRTPTSTPKEDLPNPARMWTTSNPLVLAPVASATDDSRRDPRTQTEDGAFRGACPGAANLTIASGFETRTAVVRVPSSPGRITTAVRGGARTLRRGRARRLATVGLAQPARVTVRVRRGRRVRTLAATCADGGSVRARWDGRIRSRRGRLVRAPRGLWRVEVIVRSDRRPLLRRFRLRLI
jgi:Calcineurin-like phosphoesterase